MLGYIISENEDINVEEHNVVSFNILRKTKLNIFIVENNKVLYMNFIVYNASSHGHVQVLEWFKNSGYEFIDCLEGIEIAASYGNINVLEWFKNYNIQNFDNLKNIIHTISHSGSINTIEWFVKSGFKIPYDKNCSYYASTYANIKLLEWFKNNGYPLKYDKSALLYCFNKKIINFFIKNIHIKKIILFVHYSKMIKTKKFKTKNNYIKGYNKN
jgi:hypothetical protein